MRNRASLAFRQSPNPDPVPIMGIRASPLGAYVLVIFRQVTNVFKNINIHEEALSNVLQLTLLESPLI